MDSRFDQFALEESALLQEANHRFSNHLAMLVAMLDREADLTPLREVRARIAGHVEALALLHRLLAMGAETRLLDAGSYVSELCGHLNKAYLESHGIGCRVETVTALLPTDRCRYVGLIVNELVTNAAKHAFPNGEAGTITVALRRRDNIWTVVVADDGVGINSRDHATVGMGLKLVRTLADALGARCVCRSSGAGTTVALRFRTTQANR